MNRIRSVLVGLGVLAMALALASFAAPSLVPSVSDDFVVVVLSVLIGALAVAAVQRRRRSSGERADFGAPEMRRSLPRPGTDVDRELAAGRVGPETRVTPPNVGFSDRLEPVAVDVVSRALNCAPATAAEKLNDGSWTDDPRAAAFFSDQRATELRAEGRGFFDSVLDRGPTRADFARWAILELSRLDETPASEADGAPERGADAGDSDASGAGVSE